MCLGLMHLSLPVVSVAGVGQIVKGEITLFLIFILCHYLFIIENQVFNRI